MVSKNTKKVIESKKLTLPKAPGIRRNWNQADPNLERRVRYGNVAKKKG